MHLGVQTGATFLSKTVTVSEQKSSMLFTISVGQNPVNCPFSVMQVIAFGTHFFSSPAAATAQAKPLGQLSSH